MAENLDVNINNYPSEQDVMTVANLNKLPVVDVSNDSKSASDTKEETGIPSAISNEPFDANVPIFDVIEKIPDAEIRACLLGHLKQTEDKMLHSCIEAKKQEEKLRMREEELSKRQIDLEKIQEDLNKEADEVRISSYKLKEAEEQFQQERKKKLMTDSELISQMRNENAAKEKQIANDFYEVKEARRLLINAQKDMEIKLVARETALKERDTEQSRRDREFEQREDKLDTRQNKVRQREDELKDANDKLSQQKAKFLAEFERLEQLRTELKLKETEFNANMSAQLKKLEQLTKEVTAAKKSSVTNEQLLAQQKRLIVQEETNLNMMRQIEKISQEYGILKQQQERREYELTQRETKLAEREAAIKLAGTRQNIDSYPFMHDHYNTHPHVQSEAHIDELRRQLSQHKEHNKNYTRERELAERSKVEAAKKNHALENPVNDDVLTQLLKELYTGPRIGRAL